MKALAVATKGKSTGLAIFKGKLPANVEKVRIIGREEATNAERSRDDYVLSLLQGSSLLDTSPFVQMLWFEMSEKAATKALSSLASKQGNSQAPSAFQNLNPSQRKVAMAMISHVRPLVVAHGESQLIHPSEFSELTATIHRPTWNWKDVHHCCRTRVLAECTASRLGRRSLERRRAEHCGESLQAQDRLQDYHVQRISLRMVRSSTLNCYHTN